VVEVTQARELATALISVERFDADGNFHPDYLAMLDKYRQAGVQQGLDMAAGVAEEGYSHWRDKSSATANKRESRDYETMAIACIIAAAEIRKLGVDDGTD
jgi:hypothetical protein